MAIVEFKDVSRVYTSGEHQLRALDGVDMSIDEGKFVVILGPSGAGKSTMLNLLGGLDSPTEGRIIVGGRDISTLSNDELAEYRAESTRWSRSHMHRTELMPTASRQKSLTSATVPLQITKEKTSQARSS